MIEVVTQTINDRIDYLRLKYRDTEGQERMEWKARFNEAQNLKTIIEVAINLEMQRKQTNA